MRGLGFGVDVEGDVEGDVDVVEGESEGWKRGGMALGLGWC